MERRSPDLLKPLDDVLLPDRRQGLTVLHDPKATSVYRRKTLEDQHAAVASIMLGSGVPEHVMTRFETAKNLLLYSYFVYRFIPVAEFHALATMELALRLRLGKKNDKGNFKTMLAEAEQRGLIGSAADTRIPLDGQGRGSGVAESLSSEEHDSVEEGKRQAQFRALLAFAPKFRNALAHGSTMLAHSGFHTLRMCAEIINQLFESASVAEGAAEAR